MTEHFAGEGGAVPEFDMGDRLGKALDISGTSHQEMADYLGVSRNTIGNYIALRHSPSAGTLRLWAIRTGVSLDWIKTGEAQPRPEGPTGGEAVRLDELADLTQRKRGRTTRGEPSTSGYFRAA